MLQFTPDLSSLLGPRQEDAALPSLPVPLQGEGPDAPHILQSWLPQHSRAKRWDQGSARGCPVLQAVASS